MGTLAKQQLLDISIGSDYLQEDFILSLSNLTAHKAIMNYAKWPSRSLFIIGEEGSGKTHLTKIWKNLSGASNLSLPIDLDQIDANSMGIIVENIEKISDEVGLFHLINFCKEHAIYLLMTAEYSPKFTLKDLDSRIRSIYTVQIKAPDEDILKVILLKKFSEAQIKVSPDVIEYMFTRVNRSYAFIKKIMNELDEHSLKKQKKITIPMVKEILESYKFKDLLSSDEPNQ